MVRNNEQKHKAIYNKLSEEEKLVKRNKLKEKIQGLRNKGANELKTYRKQNRLGGKVKFVLNMLSHYKFKQYLIQKADEYDCKIYERTEEYTSKCCTTCGKISEIYDVNRTKTCKYCGYKINRDINGARNILLKNIQPLIK